MLPSIVHVLVTDLSMARMNGRELRQFMPQRPQMQIIMMSGFPEEIIAKQELTPQIPDTHKAVSGATVAGCD